jgi:thioredoxin 1
MKPSFIRHHWPIVALGAVVLAGVVVISYFSVSRLIGGASLNGPFTSPTPRGETMPTVQTPPPIEHVQAGDFDEKVLRSTVPVLVDFYADWCGPCAALAPVLEQFARETPEAKIVKVDVDENPQLAARFQIEAIPCLLVFRESRLTARHVGLANKALLKQLLSR